MSVSRRIQSFFQRGVKNTVLHFGRQHGATADKAQAVRHGGRNGRFHQRTKMLRRSMWRHIIGRRRNHDASRDRRHKKQPVHSALCLREICYGRLQLTGYKSGFAAFFQVDIKRHQTCPGLGKGRTPLKQRLGHTQHASQRCNAAQQAGQYMSVQHAEEHHIARLQIYPGSTGIKRQWLKPQRVIAPNIGQGFKGGKPAQRLRTELCSCAGPFCGMFSLPRKRRTAGKHPAKISNG